MSGTYVLGEPVSESTTAGTGRGQAPSWPPASEHLLGEWHARVTSARAAHYTLATRLRRRNLVVGVPAVILSAVVGTSLFATLAQNDKVGRTLGLAIGAVSVAAAILTALQTFFRFAERAERHVVAGDWYSAVRRDLEELMALPPDQRGNPKECLDKVRKELSKIGQQSPEIGQRLWEKVHGTGEAPAAGR